MCQMKVMLDKEGQQELVMENVTELEVIEEGIRVSTFFEEPKIIFRRSFEKDWFSVR